MKDTRIIKSWAVIFAVSVLCLACVPAALAADGYGRSATGGTGGTAVTVNTAAQLIQYAQNSGTTKYIITIGSSFTITGGVGTSGGAVAVKSNKTIKGANTSIVLTGTLDLGAGGVSNVIIQNLTITNPNNIGRGDGITCYGANTVFITKCTFRDCADGSCDINSGSDNVTVSWCKFEYPTRTDHRFTMIAGNSDESNPNLHHITLHHNWWASRCDQRMPSGSYHKVHMYNNYFNCSGNSYASNSRAGAEMLSQNNYYQGVKNPIYCESGGKMKISGNTYSSCTGSIDDGNDTVFTPNYGYTLDATANVPSRVQGGAGNR